MPIKPGVRGPVDSHHRLMPWLCYTVNIAKVFNPHLQNCLDQRKCNVTGGGGLVELRLETFTVHVTFSQYFLFPWADLADHLSINLLNSPSSLWACCCIMTSANAPVYSICFGHHWLIQFNYSWGNYVTATILNHLRADLQAASEFCNWKTLLLVFLGTIGHFKWLKPRQHRFWYCHEVELFIKSAEIFIAGCSFK